MQTKWWVLVKLTILRDGSQNMMQALTVCWELKIIVTLACDFLHYFNVSLTISLTNWEISLLPPRAPMAQCFWFVRSCYGSICHVTFWK